jgi:hypothetical protein
MSLCPAVSTEHDVASSEFLMSITENPAIYSDKQKIHPGFIRFYAKDGNFLNIIHKIHSAVCLTTGPKPIPKQLSAQCDLELPPSNESILSFP